jgi:hypothetical protein
MTQTVVGYARCGADERDLAAQGQALAEPGRPEDRVCPDCGYAGTSRQRPNPGEPLAAAGGGSTFAVTNLGAVAGVGANLTKMRTREGMAIAKPNDELQGRGPNLTTSRQARLAMLYAADERSVSEPAEAFSVSRPRGYRVLARQGT